MASLPRRVGSSFDELSSTPAQEQRVTLEDAAVERANQLIDTAGELQTELMQHLVNLIKAWRALIQWNERDFDDHGHGRGECRAPAANDFVLEALDVDLHQRRTALAVRLRDRVEGPDRRH